MTPAKTEATVDPIQILRDKITAYKTTVAPKLESTPDVAQISLAVAASEYLPVLLDELERLRAAAPRDLAKVLDAMLAEVPADFTGVRIMLNRARRGALWSPPEAMAGWWHTIASELEPRFGTLDHPFDFPWERRVVEIFRGSPLPEGRDGK